MIDRRQLFRRVAVAFRSIGAFLVSLSDELILTGALALIVVGLWPVTGQLALIVPGAVWTWLAIPQRKPLVERPPSASTTERRKA